MIAALPRQRPLLGVLLVALAVLCFAVMDNAIRWLGRHLPVLLFFWARYAIQAAVMGVWLGARRGREGFRAAQPRFQALRGTLLATTSAMSFYGLQHVPAPEFTAIFLLSPLLVTLLASAWLGERVGGARRALVVGGFLGALLVVRPGSGLFGWAALYPLACAVSFATFQLLTRRLAGLEHPTTTHFYTGAVGVALLTPALLAARLDPFAALAAAPPGVAGLVVLVGLLGTVGHLLLIHALGLAPPATLMPFTYLQIGFATLVGAAAFGQWPDGWSLAGMATIAGCGAGAVVLQLRERGPVRE